MKITKVIDNSTSANKQNSGSNPGTSTSKAQVCPLPLYLSHDPKYRHCQSDQADKGLQMLSVHLCQPFQKSLFHKFVVAEPKQ